jgi:hypothetical protein
MVLEKNKTKIELLKFRGNNSSIFTGRPQGEEARIALGLDDIDKTESKVEIIIPKGTTSFNPSFYLGLLYDSIKHLGIEGFKSKYEFKIEGSSASMISVIEKNLNDGIRNAENTLLGKTGFKRFLRS